MIMGLFGFTNVLRYANANEVMFKRVMGEMGYEPKTTFFADMSMAEWYGAKGIKDTYNRVIAEWLDNIEYITEFYMVLNHKIWQLYEKYEDLARVYNDLWEKCENAISEHYKDNEDALSYFYRVTD